jgi:hypothetical protein
MGVSTQIAGATLARRGRSAVLLVALLVLAVTLSLWGVAAQIRQVQQPTVAATGGRASVQQRLGGTFEPPDAAAARRSLATLDAVRHALGEIGLKPGEATNALAARIQQQLRVDVEPVADAHELMIALNGISGLDQRQACELVNHLLQDYLAAEQRRRVADAERKYRAASDLAKAAHERLVRCRTQYEAALETALASVAQNEPAFRSAATPTLTGPGLPAHAPPVAPELQDLIQRRARLLEQRTPAHPEIIDLEERIAALQSRTDFEPPTPTDREPSAPPDRASRLTVPSHTRLETCRRAWQDAEAANQRFAQAERAAGEQLVRCRDADWQFFVPAQATAEAAVSTMPEGLMGAMVLCGAVMLAMVSVFAMVVKGRKRDHFRSAAEIERALGLPVMGVLSEDAHAA